MRNRIALVGVVVLAGLVLAAGNGKARALNAHEILVAETAEEMQLRGDYLVPYYDGAVRLEKPPLQYWLAIAAHRAIGSSATAQVSELEARLPSLVSALLLLVVTFALGRVAFDDERVGLVAVGMLATTFHFFTYARSARPETIYALLCNVAVLAFMVAIGRAGKGKPTLAAALIGWVAVTLGLLAKGPQLQLFFLAGIAIMLRWSAPRVSFRAALHPWLALLVVASVVPYFVYFASQAQGAAGFWAEQMVQGEAVPLWLRPIRLYYVFALAAGMCPWFVAVALPFLQVKTRRHPATRLLVACIVVTVVCLSFAGKLRHHYVLPAIPLACVVIAAALVELVRSVAADEPQGVGVRRLARAQTAATVVALAAIAGLAIVRAPEGGARVWLALPALALAFAAARFAHRWAATQPAGASAAYVTALFAGWSAISLGGLDVSPRWQADAQFAAAVEHFVPADVPVIVESGTHESVVYYANRHVIRSPAREWLQAHPDAPAPYVVCEGHCSDVEGELLIEERGRSEREPMILLRPLVRASDCAAEAADPALVPQ